jgi:hypothetical protein
MKYRESIDYVNDTEYERVVYVTFLWFADTPSYRSIGRRGSRATHTRGQSGKTT